MRAPEFPSSVYRERGWYPVYWYGIVLWLTPNQYAQVRRIGPAEQYPDATDAQIEAQDRWYEQAKSEREQEASDLERIFSRMRLA